MDWKEALQKEMAGAYRATEKLMELVSEEMLTWKPSEGENWMTMGQLLHHIGTGCGGGFKGFVTGDWGFPEGMDTSKMKKMKNERYGLHIKREEHTGSSEFLSLSWFWRWVST